jgi:hypothetical protein
MAQLSRKLRICKWAGMVACLLTAMAFVSSGWWGLQIGLTSPGAEVWSGGYIQNDVSLSGGVIWFRHTSWCSTTSRPQIGWHLVRDPQRGWGVLRKYPFPTIYHQQGKYLSPIYLPFDDYLVMTPLWLPFLFLLIPTVLLWRRGRRKPRPGFCQACGYDLTGNTTGICPECGQEVTALNVVGNPPPKEVR